MLAISVDEILLAQSPQWQSTASPDQPTQSWLPKFGIWNLPPRPFTFGLVTRDQKPNLREDY